MEKQGQILQLKLLKKSNIFMEKIQCLECGKSFFKPMSHVWSKHSMLSKDYKKKHGLDIKKGLIPPEHAKIMRQYALDNKMDERLKILGKNTRFKKNHKIRYQRSVQTLERLKKHGKTLTISKYGLK